YLYDLFPGKPNRFDVVVFKYPGDSSADQSIEEALRRNESEQFPKSGPQQNSVQMNYIKRLIGLGNETIGILYGDLYVMEGGISPPEPDGVPEDLWRKKYMREDEPEALDLLTKGVRFKILQKAPDKILAMRRLVYDNDKPAKDLEGVLPPRWAAAVEDGLWAKAEVHGFRYTPKDEKTLSWL